MIPLWQTDLWALLWIHYRPFAVVDICIGYAEYFWPTKWHLKSNKINSTKVNSAPTKLCTELNSCFSVETRTLYGVHTLIAMSTPYSWHRYGYDTQMNSTPYVCVNTSSVRIEFCYQFIRSKSNCWNISKTCLSIFSHSTATNSHSLPHTNTHAAKIKCRTIEPKWNECITATMVTNKKWSIDRIVSISFNSCLWYWYMGLKLFEQTINVRWLKNKVQCTV